MKTQILECEIIINSKRFPIINSEMNIELEWDIEMEKNINSVSVKIILEKIKGNVSFSSNNEHYKKITKIDFSSDSNWVLLSKNETINHQQIEPIRSKIDFDERRVIIEY